MDAVNVGALLWIVAVNSAPAAVFVGFAQMHSNGSGVAGVAIGAVGVGIGVVGIVGVGICGSTGNCATAMLQSNSMYRIPKYSFIEDE